MSLKITTLLFSLLLMAYSCDTDPQDPTPNPTFDPNDVELLVKNSDLGISTDCDFSSAENCGDNLATVNLCFDCELCKTDPDFENIGFVEILVEGGEQRTLESYGFFELDENFELLTSLCVNKRSNQTSHIIAFNLIVSDSQPSFSNVAFNNIDLDLNTPTNIKKVVPSIQFNDTSCDSELRIIYSDDPYASENLSKPYNACLIGSLGDCNVAAAIGSADNWADQTQELKGAFELLFEAYPNSTPCGGIYIDFIE